MKIKAVTLGILALYAVSTSHICYSDKYDEAIGISTVFITISPFLLTYATVNPSTQYTKNKQYRQQREQEKIIKQAKDDALSLLATDGKVGKTVRFEAAAAEIRKKHKGASDDEVARIIVKQY